jgi:hypothetical protein
MSGDNKRRFKSRAEYEAYIEARKRQRLEQLNNPKFQPPPDYTPPEVPAKPASDDPVKPIDIVTYKKPVYIHPTKITRQSSEDENTQYIKVSNQQYQRPVQPAPIVHQQYQRPTQPTPIAHQQYQLPPQIIYEQPNYARQQIYRNVENTPGIEFHGQPKLKIGGMQFRRALFWFLAMLMLCQMCYVVTTIFSVAGDNLSGNASYDPVTNPANTAGFLQDLTVLSLTGIASYAVVLCSGMLFFLFALLAWRNGAGIRQARLNHQQLMMMYQTRYSVYNPYDNDDPYGY